MAMTRAIATQKNWRWRTSEGAGLGDDEAVNAAGGAPMPASSGDSDRAATAACQFDRLMPDRQADRVEFIGRNIAAARNGDADRLGNAFIGEIMLQKLAQPARLHPHHGIGRRIEIAVLAENVHGDGKALEPVGFAGLLALDEIAQQLARAFGSSRTFRWQAIAPASRALRGRQAWHAASVDPLEVGTG